MDIQPSSEEQDMAAGTTGPPRFPIISHFEVLLTAIFPSPPSAAGDSAAAGSARTVDPRHFPSPFRHLAEARDDGRGLTAGMLPGSLAPVPRPEVLQGLFILITNPNNTPVTNLFIRLEVNTVDDAQSLAKDTLALDLRTGGPAMGTWIAPAGATYATYGLRTLGPGETTNLACIPNFLLNPAPDVSVRGLVTAGTNAGTALCFTPEQRAVFFPPAGGDVFSTVAYCLTTRSGNNVVQF